MKHIQYKSIPHNEQRYETVGDFFTDENGVEQFRVSELPEQVYEHLVLIHELVERILCHHWQITNESIDRFDMEFEKRREEGNEDEPGDNPMAPYFHAHQIATVVERLIAAELGIGWKTYNDAVCKLTK